MASQTAPLPLAHRLILPLTVLVTVVAGVSGFLRVRGVERGLRETMVVGADQVSRGITNATWHAMLGDDRQTAYDLMRTIARGPGISRIRIFNKEGRIMFSTAQETGRVVDKKAEACALCHSSAEPLVRVDAPSRARVFRDTDGTHRLAMITPIYNEPSCSAAACHAHPSGMRVLGVLDVAMDLSPVDREVAAVKLRVLVATLVEIVLISALLALFIHVLVTRPIHRLADAAGAVSRMELEEPIRTERSRELWHLSSSFDIMRQRLRETLAALNRSAQDLEAKVEERTQQLNQAHRRLVQADRLASLGQLAASVAHEINNPLSGVLNFSVLMQRILTNEGIPKKRVEEFRKYLDHVAAQTARVGHIVSDLLAFSRRSKPHRAPANLNAIVTTTMALVAHKLRLMTIDAHLDLAEDLPLVPGDASQLQQVVLNLVMNAAEAPRTEGGGRIVVGTQSDAGRKAVVLTVSDDGTGIPEETLPRIFDPFFTTKEEGKGLGLGLAVVYGIVQSHGGEIEVHSEEGKGTTFEVTLPLGAEDEGHDETPHASVDRPPWA